MEREEKRMLVQAGINIQDRVFTAEEVWSIAIGRWGNREQEWERGGVRRRKGRGQEEGRGGSEMEQEEGRRESQEGKGEGA